MSIKGKTALITGSTSGIGLGMAKRFAANGAHIVLNGFGDDAAITAIQRDIEAEGVRCLYNGADLTKPEAIEAMMAEVETEFGGLDVLVNNAGIQHVAPVDEFPVAKWDALIAIVLTATFHTTRLAVPMMKKAGWGRIINIASAHGKVASPFKSAYVAAKHGVVGFSKSVALEVAEQGITVNALCPGYVRTPLVENQIADTAKARGITEEEVVRDVLLAAQWTKQFVEPDSIADFALFLCSDAAKNVTGAALSIDGGWTTS